MIELFERHVQNIRPGTGGEFKGLCPFHDDRKPSFSFNEEGLFHCFGCKIQGNAIDFAKLVGEDRPKMAKVAKTKSRALTPDRVPKSQRDPVDVFNRYESLEMEDDEYPPQSDS